MSEKIVKTFCAMCGPTMGCGIHCHVKDGRLVYSQTDPGPGTKS